MACRLIHSPLTGTQTKSLLWDEIRALVSTDEKADEVYQKTLSPEFLQEHGNWLEGKGNSINEIGEPTINTVKEHLPEAIPSKASTDTIGKIKQFAKRVGIDLQPLSQISVEGKKIDVNGVADILGTTIQYMQGKEDTVLPEEALHFVVEILDQKNDVLLKEMLSQISAYDLYRDTLNQYKNDADYQENGKPNIRKIKKEAIAKLLVETVIKKNEGSTEKPELLKKAESFWQKVIQFFKSLIGKGGDPFEKTAEKLLDNNFEQGVAKTLTSDEKFFQLGSEKQEKVYNIFDNQLKEYGITKVENPNIEGDEERSSYYEKTIRGKTTKVAKRVTEIAKEKIGNITGWNNKYVDDITKKIWGKKAEYGTKGHADIENIVKRAIDENGFIKPREQLSPIREYTPKLGNSFYNLLEKFLVGDQTSLGLLYTFPVGSRIKTEQIIYSPKRDVGGTIDFLLITPDGKVDILDWKFMSFRLDRFTEIPPTKQKEHKIQLGQYKRILTEDYNIPYADIIQPRTIPIHAQYGFDLNKSPFIQSLTVANVDYKTEDRDYLLPVVLDDQSTGNEMLDKYIKAMKFQYDALYNKIVSPEEKPFKIEQLNAISKAIRHLQVTQNFKPAADQAELFSKQVEQLISNYKTLSEKDIKDIPQEQIDSFQKELHKVKNSLDRYASLDKIFYSIYGDEDLSAEDQKTFDRLQRLANKARFSEDKINSIQKDLVDRIAESRKIEGILNAEKALTGNIVNSVRNPSAIQTKAMQVTTQIVGNAKQEADIKTDTRIKEYEPILHSYMKWAKEKGKAGLKALSLITRDNSHQLIPRLDNKVYTEFNEASRNKNIKWFKENIDLEAYKKWAKDHIEKLEKQIDINPVPGIDNLSITQERALRKLQVRNEFSIDNESSGGWGNNYMKQFIIEDKWHTPVYKELLRPENKPALSLYNFLRTINKDAKDSGYLAEQTTLNFLPFIKSTILQRIGSQNFFTGISQSLSDLFTIQVDEEAQYSKTDPETGEPIRSIPKYFTKDISKNIINEKGLVTGTDTSMISTDLEKTIPLYIKAIEDFKARSKIEYTINAIEDIERGKRHLKTNEKTNRIIATNGKFEEFEGNDKNADILLGYINDVLYGGANTDTNRIDAFLGKEGSDKKVSLAKAINTANIIFRMKALGLNVLSSTSNFLGANLQGVINTGLLYRGREFAKNEAKIIASLFKGKEGSIEKGLIDYFVPLNESIAQEHYKQLSGHKIAAYGIQDILMSPYQVPEKMVQLANAQSILDNTMIDNGELVNIRQFIKSQPEWKQKYQQGYVREVEKEFENKVQELKDAKSLKKIARFNNGVLEIPGIKRESETVYQLRRLIIKQSKDITGQMSEEDRPAYMRSVILRSFGMFKGWIPRQIDLRASELKEGMTPGTYEYGRTRLMGKVLMQIAHGNIFKIRSMIVGNQQGIELLHKLYESKKKDYYEKNGQELKMTEDEFYDFIRTTLKQQVRELQFVLGLLSLFLFAKAHGPNQDDDDETKNLYKTWVRLTDKVSDEVLFYYNPINFQQFTSGSFFPAMGILTDASRFLYHVGKEGFGIIYDDEDSVKNAHPGKYFLKMFPIGSQIENLVIPLVDPQAAKDMGIQVNMQSQLLR